MLTKLNKLKSERSQEGFTIIEVMIVLAIAGLIMLIVFLAVPALQRNSRNTQRKSDIGRTASASQTITSNNDGDLTKLTIDTLKSELGTKLSYYTSASVTVAALAAPAAGVNTTTADTVVVYKGSTCTAIVARPGVAATPAYTAGQGATSTGANTRSIAIAYSTEAGDGLTPNCTSQ